MPNIYMEEEPEFSNVDFPKYAIVTDRSGREHEILEKGSIVTSPYWGKNSKKGSNRYLYYCEYVFARIPHNSVSGYYMLPVNEIVALVSVSY